jgi:hypothetical protein
MFPEETSIRFVPAGESSFLKEARYIQKSALQGYSRVVKFGPIIFFCANRDAWVLDPEDHFARCLMRDGEKQPLGITENRKQFLVEWNADYHIEGDVFTVAERTGSVRSIVGYPTHVIQDHQS